MLTCIFLRATITGTLSPAYLESHIRSLTDFRTVSKNTWSPYHPRIVLSGYDAAQISCYGLGVYLTLIFGLVVSTHALATCLGECYTL